jgi:multiple sugar transport system permease protein
VVLFVYVSLIAYAFVKLLGADVIGEARVRAKETKQRKAKAVTA